MPPPPWWRARRWASGYMTTRASRSRASGWIATRAQRPWWSVSPSGTRTTTTVTTSRLELELKLDGLAVGRYSRDSVVPVPTVGQRTWRCRSPAGRIGSPAHERLPVGNPSVRGRGPGHVLHPFRAAEGALCAHGRPRVRRRRRGPHRDQHRVGLAQDARPTGDLRPRLPGVRPAPDQGPRARRTSRAASRGKGSLGLPRGRSNRSSWVIVTVIAPNSSSTFPRKMKGP